jgi:hypothetical protein
MPVQRICNKVEITHANQVRTAPCCNQGPDALLNEGNLEISRTGRCIDIGQVQAVTSPRQRQDLQSANSSLGINISREEQGVNMDPASGDQMLTHKSDHTMVAASIPSTPKQTPMTKVMLNANLTQLPMHSQLPGMRHMRLLHTYHIQVLLLPGHSKLSYLAFQPSDVLADDA